LIRQATYFVGLLIAGIVVPAIAQSPDRSAAPSQSQGQSPARLKTIEKTLQQGAEERARLDRQASQVTGELEAARHDSIDLAKQIQDQEYSILLLENRIATLEQDVDRRGAALGARDHQMRVALMAIERLALHPADALTLSPLSPDDGVRAAILLRAAVPAITSSTQVLQNQLAELYRLRSAITTQREQVAADAAALIARRMKLEKLIVAKTGQQATMEGRSRDLDERMTALAQEAEDLKALFAKLAEEKARRDAEEAATPKPAEGPGTHQPAKPAVSATSEGPLRLFSAARGTLPFPAVGRIRTRYGEPGTDGQLSKGLVIATAPAATVVAPYDGVVVFAGLFRGYGQLLIIEHSEGYHSLMAGLGRIDTTVGARVLAGEPVGVMAEDGAPSLYVELRRDGQPINPLPWLAERKPEAERDDDAKPAKTSNATGG
jgi:septal ring factor EnvC (AmiA/AmiB activator)